MPIPCSPYLSFPPLTTREREVRDILEEALSYLQPIGEPALDAILSIEDALRLLGGRGV